jgi:hypothetical protein
MERAHFDLRLLRRTSGPRQLGQTTSAVDCALGYEESVLQTGLATGLDKSYRSINTISKGFL